MIHSMILVCARSCVCPPNHVTMHGFLAKRLWSSFSSFLYDSVVDAINLVLSLHFFSLLKYLLEEQSLNKIRS